MESELLSPLQVELMFKLKEVIDNMSPEQIELLEKEIDLTDEEYELIKQEQDRLINEKQKIDQFNEHMQFTKNKFNELIKTSFIPGLEVDDELF